MAIAYGRREYNNITLSYINYLTITSVYNCYYWYNFA